MTSSNQGQLAVVTGAAGGLGAQFCQQLAQQGYSLLLVDRDQAALETLAKTLADQHSIPVETRVVNLIDEPAVKELARHLAERNDLTLLVNNAGFGQTKYFVDINVEHHVAMINLHIHTPVRLCHAVLPGMLQRNQGAIINVASLSAWTPSAGIVQYSATKQYLVTFSEAMHEELRGTDVRIQALCPAFVKTRFFDTEAMDAFDERRVPGWLWIAAEDVVKQSLLKLKTRQVVVIPGFACGILGRLMRMPMAQPIVRRLATNKRKTSG